MKKKKIKKKNKTRDIGQLIEHKIKCESVENDFIH